MSIFQSILKNMRSDCLSLTQVKNLSRSVALSSKPASQSHLRTRHSHTPGVRRIDRNNNALLNNAIFSIMSAMLHLPSDLHPMDLASICLTFSADASIPQN